MLMLALRLFLKDKGGKQHCLIPFVCSNMGLRHFLKRGNIRRGCIKIEDWGSSVYFVLRFQENSMYSLDYWISLICLTMAQTRGKDIH